MTRLALWTLTTASVFLVVLLTGRPGQAGGPALQGPPQAGPGGEGPGGPPPGGVHLIPRFVEAKLNLTDDQRKQIADLEKEVKGKLAKILTADQMKTLEETRPPRRPGGGGQRGPGGSTPPGEPQPPQGSN